MNLVRQARRVLVCIRLSLVAHLLRYVLHILKILLDLRNDVLVLLALLNFLRGLLVAAGNLRLVLVPAFFVRVHATVLQAARSLLSLLLLAALVAHSVTCTLVGHARNSVSCNLGNQQLAGVSRCDSSRGCVEPNSEPSEQVRL